MRTLLFGLLWMLLTPLVDTSAASAQQPGRVYKIGWLWVGEPGVAEIPIEKFTGNGGSLRDELTTRGYVVGKNLLVDLRTAQGDVSKLPALAEALVATQPELIVTAGTAPTVAVMRATKTIPIVFVGVGSPVERRIVKSLVNHDGNATGQAVNIGNPKMWQLLRDAAPSVRRVAIVAYAPNSLAVDRSPEYRAARMANLYGEATKVGFDLVDLAVDALPELDAKVAELASSGNAALFMATDVTLFSWRAHIIEMAMRHRLPTACAQWFGWGQAGCLITYGEDANSEMGQRAALQVIKILNGTKPSDIPIEQPSKFKLILNDKTAKELGLTLPPSMLVMADEVIE